MLLHRFTETGRRTEITAWLFLAFPLEVEVDAVAFATFRVLGSSVDDSGACIYRDTHIPINELHSPQRNRIVYTDLPLRP
jgi:hypothetical protein